MRRGQQEKNKAGLPVWELIYYFIIILVLFILFSVNLVTWPMWDFLFCNSF